MNKMLPRPRRALTRAQPFERHVEGIDYGLLDELVGYAVRRAQIAMYEDIEREIAPLNITPPRFSSLALIETNPGVLQSTLARVIGVGRPAMVAIIDFLEDQGWLRREAHAGDRRANRLVLTAKGRAQLARLKKRMAELDAHWTSTMTPAEKKTLIALLGKIRPDGAPALPG